MATPKARAIRVKPKYNQRAQDEVVSALWDFAANLQLRPAKGILATTADGPNKGTKVSLAHVGQAMQTIMNSFGYSVAQVD